MQVTRLAGAEGPSNRNNRPVRACGGVRCGMGASGEVRLKWKLGGWKTRPVESYTSPASPSTNAEWRVATYCTNAPKGGGGGGGGQGPLRCWATVRVLPHWRSVHS